MGYGAALINIDAVIEEAILNSETKGGAAQKAYELCKEETNRKMSEMNALESSDGRVHGVSDSKDDKTGSNVNSQPSSKETPATKGSGRNTNAKSTASNTNAKGQKDGYRASPLLPQQQIGRYRVGSASASNTGDSAEPLFSCILPEDLISEILSERLELSDCQRGVVFDGIETTFLSSIPVALQTVLKALNNRKYIYVLNTKFTHEQYEIRIQRQELERVQQEERKRIDLLRLQKRRALRDKRKKEQEELLAAQESADAISVDDKKKKKKGKASEEPSSR